jgi:hypothetical protein
MALAFIALLLCPGMDNGKILQQLSLWNPVPTIL